MKVEFIKSLGAVSEKCHAALCDIVKQNEKAANDFPNLEGQSLSSVFLLLRDDEYLNLQWTDVQKQLESSLSLETSVKIDQLHENAVLAACFDYCETIYPLLGSGELCDDEASKKLQEAMTEEIYGIQVETYCCNGGRLIELSIFADIEEAVEVLYWNGEKVYLFRFCPRPVIQVVAISGHDFIGLLEEILGINPENEEEKEHDGKQN